MARKVDSKRLYKVVRGVVLTSSILTLILGVLYSIVHHGVSSCEKRYEVSLSDPQRAIAEISKDKCIGNYAKFLPPCESRKVNIGSGTAKKVRYGIPACARSSATVAFLVAISLPAIFYGGKALINYIAPERENNG